MKKSPLVIAGGQTSQLQTGDWIGPKNNSALVPPAASNDDTQGYEVQSRWTDTALGKEYVCVDATTGAAVWVETTGGGGGGGHVIEDEGTPVTQRPNMSFEGAGVSVADSGGKTVVTIPGGGGGGTEREVIFDPDAAPSGNVYNDFGLAVSALNAVNGQRKLIVRKLGLPYTVIPITGATYDLQGIEIVADKNSLTIFPILDFAGETLFTNFPSVISYVTLKFNNTVSPVTSYPGTFFGMHIDTASIHNNGSQPVFNLSAGTAALFNIGGTTSVGMENSGSAEVIRVASGVSVTIEVSGNTNFRNMNNLFSSDGTGGQVTIYIQDLHAGGYSATHTLNTAVLAVTELAKERIEQYIDKRAQTVFYYDTGAAPSGNVFNDLGLLLTAAQAVTGKKIIYIVAAAGSVPAGSYNFAGCELYNVNEDVNAIQPLVFADNVTIVNFPEVFTAKLHFNNTVFPVCATVPGYFEIRGDGVLQNLGSQHIVALSGTQVARFAMRDRAVIQYSGLGKVFYQLDTSQLFLTIADNALVVTGSLDSDGSETEFLTVYDYTLKPGGVPALNAGSQIYTVTKYQETRVGEIISARNLAAALINPGGRVLNSIYINGNKPRFVTIVAACSQDNAGNAAYATFQIGAEVPAGFKPAEITGAGVSFGLFARGTITALVPPGSNYRLTDTYSDPGTTVTIISWYEQDLSL